MILTHGVLALGWHGVVSAGDGLVVGIVVTTLKPAIVAKHNVSIRLFSCNLLVVVSLDRLLAGFEAGEGLVTKREKVSQSFRLWFVSGSKCDSPQISRVLTRS